MTVPEPALVIMPTPPTTTPLMPGQPAPGKRQGWPGLWFDPAPGAPESLGTLADGLAALPSALRNARDVLAPLRGTPESWSGAAADAFAGRVAELPERLDGLRRSLVAAAGTLRCWQVALAQLRARARLVEADAHVARRRWDAALVVAEAARTHTDLALDGQRFDTDEELADAQCRLDSALSDVADANAQVRTAHARLDALVRSAEQVGAEHRAAAARAAAALRVAAAPITRRRPTEQS
ncbi:MAG TPA: hypothetical protein VNP03_06575 [Pseudonocardia sp.]|nr:hypothetical protein [Pseudonocardia sp.]